MPDVRAEVLVLGTADWNQAIATNQHYVVREMALGLDAVTFVESQGLRRPQIGWRDLRRVLKRLAPRRARATPARRKPDNVDVVSPLVIPLHTRATRSANRALLHRQVAHWRTSEDFRLLWTYTPVTYDLDLRSQATVYHCVDLLGTFPGIDPKLIESEERKLASRGALAIASSRVVEDHLRTMGFSSVLLWENVADTRVFETAVRTAQQARNPKRVVFAGNLSPKKVDFALLERLAKEDLELVIAGPRAEGGGGANSDIRRLTQLGVHDLGLLGLEALARLTASASVGLIPYLVNDYTRGVSPLKTFEYAAAGMTVVSTPLPGVAPDPAGVFVAGDHDEFVRYVLDALAWEEGAARQSELMRLARDNSWEGRGAQVRSLIDGLTAGQSV